MQIEINRFLEQLSQGQITPLDSLSETISEDFKKWYKDFCSHNFIPLHQDFHELILHSPKDYQIKYFKESHHFQLDHKVYYWEERLSHLALSNKQNWNLAHPFCSFKAQISGNEYRVTLVSKHTLTSDYSKIFIRKMTKQSFPLTHFLKDSKHEQILDTILSEKKNLIISGPTGSGKTSFLNTLLQTRSQFNEHLISIEDTEEIKKVSETHTQFIAKESDNYTMRSYCKYSLRMHPDRVIIGEIRSDEVVPLILSMNTGQTGVMVTIHANNAQETIERLATLFQTYTSMQLSKENIISLLCKSIHYVAFIKDQKLDQLTQIISNEGQRVFTEDVVFQSKNYGLDNASRMLL